MDIYSEGKQAVKGEGCSSSTFLGVYRWVECCKGKYNHKHEIKVKEKGKSQGSPHGQSLTWFL